MKSRENRHAGHGGETCNQPSKRETQIELGSGDYACKGQRAEEKTLLSAAVQQARMRRRLAPARCLGGGYCRSRLQAVEFL